MVPLRWLVVIELCLMTNSLCRGSGDPFPSATPESVGLSSAALEKIATGVRELIDDQEAVGAEVLILKNRKVVLHEVFGWQDQEKRQPLQRNTICCIRSMTKPVVGTAIQMLVDEGKLALTDRASKYLPSFDNKKSRDVTIEQLLTHTAGFPITLISLRLSAYSGQREVADQAGQIGPSGKPGAFSYSDSDTETLAAIVAQVSGQPIEEFIQKRILEPLGMSDTYCVLRKDAPPRARVSSNHAGSVGLWHKYWDHEEAPFFPFFLGAAAMYSTTTDYARFLALWLDRGMVGSKRLLSEAAVDRALRPAVPMLTPGGGSTPYPTGFPGLRLFYGLHWMVYEPANPGAKGKLPIFGHGGSDGTLALVFPEQDLMAFYFTQSRGGLSSFRFEELLAPLVGLKDPPVRTRLPVEKLKPYIGYFEEAKGKGRADVWMRGSRLLVTLVGQIVAAPRWPDSAGRWAFDESAPDMAISFDRNAAGDVTVMRLWNGGKEEATFQKVLPAKDWPTVENVMALRRAKQGGDHLDSLRTLELKGKLKARQAQLDVSFVVAGADRVVRRVSTGAGTEIVVFTEGRAWKQSGGQPVEELTGLFYEQTLRINPLARLGDWRKTAKDVQIVGKERVGDEDVWIVQLAGEFQPPTLRYVGVQSGRLLKEETWLSFKGVGTVPHSIRYEDFRDVAGVTIPFRYVNDSALTGHQVVQITEAKANPELPKDAFAVPGGRK